MSYLDLAIFIITLIPLVIYMIYLAHKSPKQKLIGMKSECCKTGMAIQPVFNENKSKILLWECIHCHRIFHYITSERSSE